jgi:tagatose 1,6-diphosphate aldolase GatY/KbaY
MGLVNTLEMMKYAQKNKIAIPAFNIHNLETIQAVVEGAAEENSPVIIQTTPGTVKYAGLEYIAEICKVAADKYDVPIALHVDHCPSYELIVRCVQAGYSSVMIDGAELPYDENVALVSKVVELCHNANISVEGEIGRLGGVEDDMSVDEADAALTIPSEAKQFVEDTGIDSLAIAIGTAHGMYKGVPKLDFPRLTSIEEVVDQPLVLHGASGLQDEQVKEAVKRGICKVNIATELKNPLAATIKTILTENPEQNDPRKYIGVAREEVKKVVINKIRLCGANGHGDKIGV